MHADGTLFVCVFGCVCSLASHRGLRYLVCVCGAFYSPTTRYLSYNKTDHRESFKFGIFALFRSNGVFTTFSFFLSLGTLCSCVSVTTFSPTTLFSGAWRRFKFGFFYKDTSFESYYAFSL